jgi:serine/threonine protein kinase/WD40 repeat protein
MDVRRPLGSSEIDPLDVVAEEIAERLRGGERPSPSEYTRRYPDLSDRISALFPTLVAMEEFGAEVGPMSGPPKVARELPERVGDFRILRPIGAGGMGVVYEALQESLGRHVALKLLPHDRTPQARERFRREARTAARLHHTNIVPVFAVGEAGDVHYYAMQYIQGLGLDAVLQAVRALREGPSRSAQAETFVEILAGSLTGHGFSPSAQEDTRRIPPGIDGSTTSDLAASSDRGYFREVARLGIQAAEALAHAHAQGVIHRDIKPSNLLLDAGGTLWIADFGLAKAEGSDDLTQPGDLVGTLRYMAPERFRGPGDALSDVYSLGATLYEMLTLRPAYAEGGRLSLLEQVLQAPPSRPRRINPRIPRDLETIVLKAMAREPSERYRSAGELAADLGRFLDNRPIHARRTTVIEELWRWGRRNPVLAALAASVLLLLTLMAVGGWLVALHIERAREQAVQLGLHAKNAEHQRTRQLARSLLDSARASRSSRRPGQRFRTLETIAEAARIGWTLDESNGFFDELRTQAIAALALPDIQVPAPSPRERETLHDASARALAVGDSRGDLRIIRGDGPTQVIPAGDLGPSIRVRLSAEGRIVAARSEEGFLRIWDLDLSPRDPVLEVPSGVTAHDVSQDGRALALARENQGVEIVDLAAAGQASRPIPGRRIVTDLAFDESGRRLAIAGADGVAIVEVASGSVAAETLRGVLAETAAWHPAGTELAVGDQLSVLSLVDPLTGRIKERLGARTAGLKVAYSPDGDSLYSSGWDGVLRIWDPRSGRLRLSVQPATDLYLSRSGSLLDRTRTHGWAPIAVASGREFRALAVPASGRPMEILSIAAVPGGHLLIAAMRNSAGLWDQETGRWLGELPVSAYRVRCDSQGRILIHGKQGISSWPVHKDSGPHWTIGPPTWLAAPEPNVIMAVACSRDGQTVAGTFRAGVGVLRRDPPGPANFMPAQDDVRELAVSSDGRWVAVGSWTPPSGAVVFEAATGQAKARFPVAWGASVLFSPDDRFLVVGSGDALQQVWRVGTWEEVARFQGVAVAFPGDSRMMAVAGSDGAVELVDPETSRLFARLEPPEQDRAYRLALSDDGAYLAIGWSLEKPVDVWDIRTIRAELADLGLDWEGPRLANERGEPIESLEVICAGSNLDDVHTSPSAKELGRAEQR